MSASSVRDRIPLGVAHFSAITLPPIAFARHAARAGFTSIGLRLHPAFPGAPFYALPQGSQAAREFRSVLDGEGMDVFDIEFFILDADFSAQTIEPVIAAAADLGATRLTACGDDGDRSRLTANLSSFCHLAAEYGMSIDVENMGWRIIATPSDSAALVAACGVHNAGILVDALHFFRNGASVDDLDTLIERVRHVQLCDAAGPAPKLPEEMIAEARGGRLAPGDGDLPITALIAKLHGRAAFSVEVPHVGPIPVEEHLGHLRRRSLHVLQMAAQHR